MNKLIQYYKYFQPLQSCERYKCVREKKKMKILMRRFYFYWVTLGAVFLVFLCSFLLHILRGFLSFI